VSYVIRAHADAMLAVRGRPSVVGRKRYSVADETNSGACKSLASEFNG